jgi:hypothetical protein
MPMTPNLIIRKSSPLTKWAVVPIELRLLMESVHKSLVIVILFEFINSIFWTPASDGRPSWDFVQWDDGFDQSLEPSAIHNVERHIICHNEIL